jgi:hypothetical protein
MFCELFIRDERDNALRKKTIKVLEAIEEKYTCIIDDMINVLSIDGHYKLTSDKQTVKDLSRLFEFNGYKVKRSESIFRNKAILKVRLRYL